MDEDNGFDASSIADSTDLLWDSVKLHINTDRAEQDVRFQALRGIMVKPAKKQKRKKKVSVKKPLQRKIFQRKVHKKALEILRGLSQKLKRDKRCNASKDITSTMNFKVLEQLGVEQPCGNQTVPRNIGGDKSMQDVSVQTDKEITGHVFSQTRPVSVQTDKEMTGYVFPPTRPPPDFNSLFNALPQLLPLVSSFVLPCAVQLGTMNNLCGHGRAHSCCSAPSDVHQTGNLDKVPPSSMSRSVETTPSLRTICAELLAQLNSQESSGEPPVLVQRNTNVKDNNQTVRALGVHIQHRSTSAEPEVTAPVLPEINQVHHACEKLREALKSSCSKREVGVIVTPDLLRFAGDNCETQKGKPQVLANEPRIFRFIRDEGSDPSSRSDTPVDGSTNTKMTQSELKDKNGRPAGLSVNGLAKNSVNVDQAKEDGSHATHISSSLSQVKHDGTPENLMSSITPPNVQTDVEKASNDNVLMPPPKAPSKVFQASIAMNSKSTSSNRYMVTNLPEGVQADLDDTQSQSQGADVKRNLANTFNKPQKANSLESKSLAVSPRSLKYISDFGKNFSKGNTENKNKNAQTSSRLEITKSPAFEDMDSVEMENVLLIWRQQEQLHQSHEEPAKAGLSTNPSNVFRKDKKPPKLPEELQNFKVFKPPSLKRHCDLDTSALEIIDNEKMNSATEDDDVPEMASQPVIEPAKKRKLRLNKTPPSPLPIVFQKSKETEKTPEIEAKSATEVLNALFDRNVGTEQNATKPDLATTANREGETEETASVSGTKRATRSSSRLRLSLSTAKGKASAVGKPAGNITKPASNSKNVEDETTIRPNSKKKKETQNQESRKENVTSSHNTSAALSEEDEELKTIFVDQINERIDRLKKQWAQEKSAEKSPVLNTNRSASPPVPPTSPSPPVATDHSQDISLSQRKVMPLREVPIVEIGRAHDLVTHILLNPWRGINAKCVTRGFVCPRYDSKTVSRLLWDLRSHCGPDEVTERLMLLDWEGIHSQALRSLVSMFTLALSRHVPFIIEADQRDDDDTCSNSDVDINTKRKTTPIRVVSSQPIFKGECIEGMNGLLIKVSKGDKEKLRAWTFPKFDRKREWALFGPLAYVKRKADTDCNIQAVIIQGELIGVKASRQIVSGEKLYVSFSELEDELNL